MVKFSSKLNSMHTQIAIYSKLHNTYSIYVAIVTWKLLYYHIKLVSVLFQFDIPVSFLKVFYTVV